MVITADSIIVTTASHDKKIIHMSGCSELYSLECLTEEFVVFFNQGNINMSSFYRDCFSANTKSAIRRGTGSVFYYSANQVEVSAGSGFLLVLQRVGALITYIPRTYIPHLSMVMELAYSVFLYNLRLQKRTSKLVLSDSLTRRGNILYRITLTSNVT